MSGVETASIPSDTLSRRGGLIGWGVLLIVVGCLGALGNIGSMMGTLGAYQQSPQVQSNYSYAASHSRPIAPDVSWKAMAMDVFSLAMFSGIVWTGIASCTGRRWTRPVVLIFCGFCIAIWLFYFVGMTLTLPSVIDAATIHPGRNRAMPMPMSILLLYAIRAALILGGGVVLPYVMFRYYASPSTRQLLDSVNPQHSWTDGIPIPVLGWTAVCVLASLGMIYEIDLPAIPCFTFARGLVG